MVCGRACRCRRRVSARRGRRRVCHALLVGQQGRGSEGGREGKEERVTGFTADEGTMDCAWLAVDWVPCRGNREEPPPVRHDHRPIQRRTSVSNPLTVLLRPRGGRKVVPFLEIALSFLFPFVPFARPNDVLSVRSERRDLRELWFRLVRVVDRFRSWPFCLTALASLGRRRHLQYTVQSPLLLPRPRSADPAFERRTPREVPRCQKRFLTCILAWICHSEREVGS